MIHLCAVWRKNKYVITTSDKIQKYDMYIPIGIKIRKPPIKEKLECQPNTTIDKDSKNYVDTKR